MSNIFNLLTQNFFDFNLENKQDIIRAEKILKAQLKINQELKNQDIEKTIDFYKKYGNQYHKFLSDKKFMNIFLNKGSKIIYYKINLETTDKENLREFGNIFESEIIDFIKTNINNYEKLEYFIREYELAISINCKELLTKLFSEKLQIIGINLQNHNYNNFYSDYIFAFNPYFYKCTSILDSDFFEKDILRISKFGEYESRNKKENITIGKILDAMSYFKSSNEEINQYLQHKKNISKLLRKDEETLFSKLEESLQKNWVEKKDSWKDVVLIIFYFSLFIGSLIVIYLYFPIYVFGFEVAMIGILFFTFLGAPNNWGVYEYDTSEYTFIRHFKKFSLSLYIIFRYILFVLIIGNVFIGILAFLAYITM